MCAWSRRLASVQALHFRPTLKFSHIASNTPVQAKGQHALRTTLGETPARSSRVYVLGRRKEHGIDINEALRALRAYSLTRNPETVVLDIKVDMRIKKVGII